MPPSGTAGNRAGRPASAGRDAVWAALADPTRRRLLDHLSTAGPATATELAPDFPMSRQAVVKHLGALADAGLVAAERSGREVKYRVQPDAVLEPTAWLAEVGARWDRRLEALRRQLADHAGPEGGTPPAPTPPGPTAPAPTPPDEA